MQLPEDIAKLEEQLDPTAQVVVAMLKGMIEELQKSNDELREQIADLRQMLFGRKSEKIPSIESEVRRAVEQQELFGDDWSVSESDDEAVDCQEAERITEQRTTKRRQRGRRKSEKQRQTNRLLKKNLPVLTEQISVTPDKLPDGYSIEDFRSVGEGKTIVRFDHVKEHLVMVEYVLQTLASKDGEHIISAEAPVGVTDKGQYGPGVYALAVSDKCADSLPLNRISERFARRGYPLSRSTLCSLFHRCANLLEPIYKLLLQMAKSDVYVNADETTMPIQKRGGCKKGWMWTVLSRMVIAYVFSESRSSEVAKELLSGTTGYLHVDGYSAYNSVCKEGDGRDRVACWAHVRRLFWKALKNFTQSRQILELIIELYRVEYRAAEKAVLGTVEHLQMRKAESQPVLDNIFELLEEIQPEHPPKSQLGKAIKYTLKRENDLRRFVDDPLLNLDNNSSERALRIMALGRKNFLFVGNEQCGTNLAVLQTIVSTCKLHGIDPYDYIKDVLIRIRTHPAKQIEQLLPQNWVQLSN